MARVRRACGNPGSTRRAAVLAIVTLAAACGEGGPGAGGPDASTAAVDAAPSDGDAPQIDADIALIDASEDAGDADPGPLADAGAPDSQARDDAGGVDSGARGDAAVADSSTGSRDAGPPADTGPVEPLPLRPYSGGACPTLVGGPTSSTSVNRGFVSRGAQRQFRLIVPRSYDGTSDWPLVIGWHWLNASSSSFVRDAELETATEEMRFIAALPDKQLKPNGDKAYLFDWPFVETSHAEEELGFLDDMLACISAQYRVDRRRVYGIGVSAGGLWTAHVATSTRAGYFAAIETLSGGLGEVAGVWRMEYTPQPNKFPALVLWGGPRDWLGVNFERASIKLRDELLADGHFVVACTHDDGHAMPPIEPPPGGGTKFRMLWRFMLDHPFGVVSPYLQAGLPSDFASWCAIAGP